MSILSFSACFTYLPHPGVRQARPRAQGTIDAQTVRLAAGLLHISVCGFMKPENVFCFDGLTLNIFLEFDKSIIYCIDISEVKSLLAMLFLSWILCCCLVLCGLFPESAVASIVLYYQIFSQSSFKP